MSKERVQKFIIYRESIKHIKMSKLFVYGVDQNLSNSEIQVRLFLSFVCKYEIPCCESVKVLDTDPSKSSEYDSNFDFFFKTSLQTNFNLTFFCLVPKRIFRIQFDPHSQH